mgnify:CR=1 FL=1
MHQRTWLSLLTLPLVAGFTYPMVVPRLPQAKVEGGKASQDPLAGLADIQDVLTYVRDNYVDPVDMNKVLAGGVRGALERAHPLNAFLTAEDLRLPDPGPGSLGIRVLRRGIYASVLSVLPGSPAAKAGLLAGDVIRKVDGTPVAELNQPLLERRLRGPVGSSVTLLRYAVATGETRSLTLSRAAMAAPAVTLRREAGVVVAELPDLADGRTEELRAQIQPADARSVLLLDLRRCHGGTVAEAGRLAASLGLKGGLGVLQEPGKSDEELRLPPMEPLGLTRVASLSGFGTAGAAELVVSALKKEGRTTYGDRSVALGVKLVRLPLRQGGAVELVQQRWQAVGGERLDRQGVLPETQLRGLRPEDDPVPRVIELIQKGTSPKASLLTPPGLRPKETSPRPWPELA